MDGALSAAVAPMLLHTRIATGVRTCRFGHSFLNSLLTVLSVLCVDFVGIGIMWATTCWCACSHGALRYRNAACMPPCAHAPFGLLLRCMCGDQRLVDRPPLVNAHERSL